MQTLNEFAKRLTEERKRLGLTQVEFANACGVKAASQWLYEKADRSPNAEYLLKASALGVRVGYLIDGGSINTMLTLSPVDLGKIFKQCDDESRDSLGKLSDLEDRTQRFISMVESITNMQRVG